VEWTITNWAQNMSWGGKGSHFKGLLGKPLELLLMELLRAGFGMCRWGMGERLLT